MDIIKCKVLLGFQVDIGIEFGILYVGSRFKLEIWVIFNSWFLYSKNCEFKVPIVRRHWGLKPNNISFGVVICIV